MNNPRETERTEQMMDEQLQASITRLRQALGAIDESRANRDVPKDVELAVDDLRRSFWGVLTTTFAADAEEYLVQMRIRRAREILTDVLADLYTGTLAVGRPGSDELGATARQLYTALAGVMA